MPRHQHYPDQYAAQSDCGCPTELATDTLAPSAPPTDATPPAATPQVAPWEGTLGVEGELTGDGRLIQPNSLRWETPLPLRYVYADVGGHDGAVTVGTILTVTRKPGGKLWGTGTIDLDTPAGVAAAGEVGKGRGGVSMDLDDVSFEIRVVQELLDEDPMLGMMLGHDHAEEEEAVEDAPPPEVDADGRVKVAEIGSADEVRVTTDGRVRAGTIVGIPAFIGAFITLTDATPAPAVDMPAALAASAAPAAPPAAWFAAPDLGEVTPLTVSNTGRVFGHLAAWGTCHTSHTAPGQCVTAPHSATGYSYFHTGAIVTDAGTEVAVGHLTLNTRHAGDRLSAVAAAAHYEDTGAVVADVVAGEDTHGIYVAGAIRPTATDQQVRELRSSPLSGDWRRLNGNLELVAALGVNVPGFPIPRPAGLVAGGLIQSLVASGMVAPRDVAEPSLAAPGLTPDDLRYLRRLADTERDRDTATARRVHAFALHRRAHH